jgi:hypothetical protein
MRLPDQKEEERQWATTIYLLIAVAILGGVLISMLVHLYL